MEGKSSLTVISVAKVVDELEALGEPSEDGELSVERIRAEEEVEHTLVLCLTGFPVRVGHGDLVEIWERGIERERSCYRMLLMGGNPEEGFLCKNNIITSVFICQ